MARTSEAAEPPRPQLTRQTTDQQLAREDPSNRTLIHLNLPQKPRANPDHFARIDRGLGFKVLGMKGAYRRLRRPRHRWRLRRPRAPGSCRSSPSPPLVRRRRCRRRRALVHLLALAAFVAEFFFFSCVDNPGRPFAVAARVYGPGRGRGVSRKSFPAGLASCLLRRIGVGPGCRRDVGESSRSTKGLV